MTKEKTIADINRAGKQLAPLYRNSDGFSFKSSVNSIQMHISSMRRKNREVEAMGVEAIKRRMLNNVHAVVANVRGRTTFSFIAGEGTKGGEKPDRSRIRLKIGWMWGRRVWVPFYKGRQYNIQIPQYSTCLIPPHLFVVDAEEVRINHRRAKLYEALLYDMNANENVKRYIATAFVDKEMLAIGQTPAAAIRAIEEQIEEAVTKKMKGDGQ